MKNYIENKTALITGASSGIGERLAIDLATMGLNLILTARDIHKLTELKTKLSHICDRNIDIYKMDVCNRDEVKKTISDIAQKYTVDILINNAGLALGIEKIDEGEMDSWDSMIDTNIKGLLYVSRYIIPHMKNLDTAHIINLGSVAGKTAYPGGNVYCATKAAVHSISESMNADLYGTNVKVTAIAPGAVHTNFSNIRFSGDEKKASDVYNGYEPLLAEDISSIIVNVLNTPKHVNIQYLDIMPTAQRNPYLLYRDNS